MALMGAKQGTLTATSVRRDTLTFSTLAAQRQAPPEAWQEPGAWRVSPEPGSSPEKSRPRLSDSKLKSPRGCKGRWGRQVGVPRAEGQKCSPYRDSGMQRIDTPSACQETGLSPAPQCRGHVQVTQKMMQGLLPIIKRLPRGLMYPRSPVPF